LREATDPPAAVNVLDVSSESMAAFQVFTYGRFWVFTEEGLAAMAEGKLPCHSLDSGSSKLSIEDLEFEFSSKRSIVRMMLGLARLLLA
jgi:hypothetical protein